MKLESIPEEIREELEGRKILLGKTLKTLKAKVKLLSEREEQLASARLKMTEAEESAAASGDAALKLMGIREQVKLLESLLGAAGTAADEDADSAAKLIGGLRKRIQLALGPIMFNQLKWEIVGKMEPYYTKAASAHFLPNNTDAWGKLTRFVQRGIPPVYSYDGTIEDIDDAINELDLILSGKDFVTLTTVHEE